MKKYDTPAIRRLARQLESIAEKLSVTERDACKHISGISDDMLGDTPKAIDTATGRLSSELQAIRSGLTRNAASLYQYARELDIADAKAQNMIKQN